VSPSPRSRSEISLTPLASRLKNSRTARGIAFAGHQAGPSFFISSMVRNFVLDLNQDGDED
jgi:hypothetical protein